MTKSSKRTTPVVRLVGLVISCLDRSFALDAADAPLGNLLKHQVRLETLPESVPGISPFHCFTLCSTLSTLLPRRGYKLISPSSHARYSQLQSRPLTYTLELSRAYKPAPARSIKPADTMTVPVCYTSEGRRYTRYPPYYPERRYLPSHEHAHAHAGRTTIMTEREAEGENNPPRKRIAVAVSGAFTPSVFYPSALFGLGRGLLVAGGLWIPRKCFTQVLLAPGLDLFFPRRLRTDDLSACDVGSGRSDVAAIRGTDSPATTAKTPAPNPAASSV